MGRKDKPKALKLTPENSVSRLAKGIRDIKPTSYSKLEYSAKRTSRVYSSSHRRCPRNQRIIQVHKASGRPDFMFLHKTGWRANRWLLPQDLKASKKDIEKKRVSWFANKTEMRQGFDIPMIKENLEGQSRNTGDSLNFAHRTQPP